MQSVLVSAYRATDYVAQGHGCTAVIRVGQQASVVDALLARMHVRNGTFITAWNPFSKSLSVGANECRNRDLKRYLTVCGFAFVGGEGRGKTEEWPPESSVLAFGVSRSSACAIGRRYQQNAIVFVQRGRPAELIMLRWLR
jgi:hypothetical protein